MKINNYTLQIALKMFKCLSIMPKKLGTSNSHRFQLVLKILMISKRRKYNNKTTQHKTPHNPIHVIDFLEMPT